MSKKVFIVHGHDSELKVTVARFLEHLQLDAVILHERQAGGSKSLMEKLENHLDVAFAVVLITPDDIGGPAGAPHTALRFRARQNVIFELGLFVGRLGRGRVHCLKLGDIEIPTDYAGIEYTPVDDPAVPWKLRLAGELREAGIAVDFNRIR
jgi:predicted nucleotide-binding protein